MNQKWVSFRVISLVNCDRWTMSFPCKDTELFLAQNTFSEQGFRWKACQQEIVLFILILALLLPSAARQQQVWAWPCLVLQWRCSCPAAWGWQWVCVCAGKRQVLVLVWSVLCGFDANKARNPAWKKNSNRQEILSYCGYLNYLFFLFFLSFLLLSHICGAWSCLFQL